MKIRRNNKTLLISPKSLILSCLIFTLLGILLLTFITGDDLHTGTTTTPPPDLGNTTVTRASCATVEEMGNESVDPFGSGDSWKESLRVRKLIRNHFEIQGIMIWIHLSLF